jgi:hypothetical protein
MARKKYAMDDDAVSETESEALPDDRNKAKVPTMDGSALGHEKACPYRFVDDEDDCSWCKGYVDGQAGVNSVRWNEGWAYGKAD